jgi:hypothetical protein
MQLLSILKHRHLPHLLWRNNFDMGIVKIGKRKYDDGKLDTEKKQQTETVKNIPITKKKDVEVKDKKGVK